ncbi:MAG: prepilin-type N-terminal cleavage/methylation domain-containing protein [Verrucomicrobiota bacterium]
MNVEPSTLSVERFVLKMRMLPRPRAAFTLIELLVVVSIIVVLMALAFPAFRGALDRAKKVQAKNDLTQIVTAINAFYTEYGKYPVVTDDTPITNSGDVFYALRAVSNGANAGDATNPRRIVFMNVPDVRDITKPRAGIGIDGQFYDPWGTPYKIAIDGDYDNQIANPYGSGGGAGSDPLRQGVVVRSFGKDIGAGHNGDNIYRTATGIQSDDVISWQ